jgi:hypothetical protein
MKKNRAGKKAYAFIEYLAMILVIIVALTLFRFYIQHGFQGQMMRSGETFGFGRQFDHSDTLVCKYDDKNNGAIGWYSEACYKHELAKVVASGVCSTLAERRVCEDLVKMGCGIGCR